MLTKQPNIVVVICHDLGQSLGCYGDKNARTPAIDRFAKTAIRFENSFCTAPQCSPSRAALWTGRYPHSNGVVGLTHGGFQNDLNPDECHLAQMLGALGYETHLFGGQHEADTAERCGHHQRHAQEHIPCDQVTDAFSKVLSQRGDSKVPFFSEICFFEPHRPFWRNDVAIQPPQSMTVPPYLPDIPAVREGLADFEASVASADRAFGRIVDEIKKAGIEEETVVVFTADHGFPFPHAKMTLYDPGIAVPLIMRIPGQAGGQVFPEMISNVDFVPTILEMLGTKIPSNIQGRSFWGKITGKGYQHREAVFAEKTYHTYYDPMRTIRTERWKLIANFEFAPWQETSPDYDNNAKGYVETSIAMQKIKPSDMCHPPFELFDLKNDPWEQHNLADNPEHKQTRDALIRKLRQWMEETGDPLLAGPVAQGAYRARMATFKQI